jgi:peptidoglycan/LPS O-acetylase OafA/YrhL
MLASSPDLRQSLWGTVYYMGFFVAGALMARRREAIVEAFRTLGKPTKGALVGLSLVMYLYTHVTGARLHAPLWVMDWMVGTGAMMLMVAAMGSSTLGRLLRHAVPQYLGRISYSLYLFHPIVILASMYLLHAHLRLGVIAVLDIPLLVLAAHLAYQLVEQPSIRLGRSLSRRFATPAPTAPVPEQPAAVS